MDYRLMHPTSLAEALAMYADHPGAIPLAGGNDVMAGINAGHIRPTAFLVLRDIPEMQGWVRKADTVQLGSGLTYAQLLTEGISPLAPVLGLAAAQIGSPQIRNRGTIGGAIAGASLTSDILPALAALEAEIVCASGTGIRNVALVDLISRDHDNSLRPGELILRICIPALSGPQRFTKVARRHIGAVALASFALVLDTTNRLVRCSVGAIGPIPQRTLQAEQFAAEHINWARPTADSSMARRFGQIVAEAVRPADDYRASTEYRRHAVRVCATRALTDTLTAVTQSISAGRDAS